MENSNFHSDLINITELINMPDFKGDSILELKFRQWIANLDIYLPKDRTVKGIISKSKFNSKMQFEILIESSKPEFTPIQMRLTRNG